MGAVLVLIAVGLLHPVRGIGAIALHPVAINAAGGLAPVSLEVLAIGALSAVYATVGGNQALGFGEELREPRKNMGRVVVIACMLGAVCTATPVILLALSVTDFKGVLGGPAPFAAFLSGVLGPWAGPALGACVALAIFNATIVSIMGYARLFFSLGRDQLFTPGINRLLSTVDAKSGAPRVATLVVGVFALGCCFLPSHVLLIFMTGLLVYGWGLVCLAVWIGRLKGMTGGPGFWRSPLFPLAPLLGLGMAVAFTVADLFDPDAGRPSLLMLGAVVLAALAWHRFVLSRRPGGWTPTLD
jgi:amino acid transporter